MLEDIAILTGGRVMSEDAGLKLENTDITDLGRCGRMVINKERLQERLAKLAGGVAVIQVGAATETEMKEKKARVEDALAATRAAVEEGIVAGGGVTLLRCVKVIDKLELEGEELVGGLLVRRALEEPVRIIAANAGAEGSVIVEHLRGEKAGIGYNAATGKYVDMFKAGIVDPAKM